MFAYDSEAAGLNEVFSWGSIYVESKGAPHFEVPFSSLRVMITQLSLGLKGKQSRISFSLWSPREHQAGKVPVGNAY